MAQAIKGELQNNIGEVMYPHTSMDLVFDEFGKTLTTKLAEIESSIPTAGSEYTHPATHDASMITGLPEVKNTLEETTVGNTLDATQGKILNDKIDALVIPEEYVHPATHPASMITGLPEVKNTLTETTAGNVLDAVQGKILNDKIDALVIPEEYTHPATHDASMITGLPEVKNTLEETVAGNVLDAVQGKILNDKIEDIKKDKIDTMGGVSTNLRLGNTIITNSMYNPTNGFLIKTGLYKYNNTMTSLRLTGCAYNNMDILDTRIELYCFAQASYPVNIVVYCSGKAISPKLFYIDSELYIFIEKWSSYPTLKAEITTGHYTGDFYPEIIDSAIPEYDEGSLVEPEPITSATINKTNLNITPKAGYMLTEESLCTKIGNIGYFIDIAIKKIDETIFISNERIDVLSLPFSKSNIPLICNSYSLSGTQSSGNTTAMIRGNNLLITPLTDTHIIEVSGFIPI